MTQDLTLLRERVHALSPGLGPLPIEVMRPHVLVKVSLVLEAVNAHLAQHHHQHIALPYVRKLG
jgi:hypothetical protein